MDTEVTLGQQSAPSSVTVRSEEVGGHAPSLAERFAGIVYFSDMAADSQVERRSTRHRTGGGVSGAEPVRSARGRRAPARPWRLPAVNRIPKS